VNSQIHDEEPTPETAEAKASSAEQGNGVTQAMYDALQGQAQEYLEGWQRNRAEFANYKKRIEREMKDNHANAAGSVLRDILPAIDDFERAMSNTPEALKDDKWVGGVGMVLRKFNKILDDYNVIVLDPVGEPFDPNRHEAIGMDDSEDVATGHVTATMQKGYVLGDRVLRPALVRVAK
jgi:molecular chaperone GrpE